MHMKYDFPRATPRNGMVLEEEVLLKDLSVMPPIMVLRRIFASMYVSNGDRWVELQDVLPDGDIAILKTYSLVTARFKD